MSRMELKLVTMGSASWGQVWVEAVLSSGAVPAMPHSAVRGCRFDGWEQYVVVIRGQHTGGRKVY